MADQDLFLLTEPLRLPSGAVLPNRLAKPAMSDSLGDGAGNPTSAQARLYERWTEGGVGLSIIGEVQTDPAALEKPGNLVLTDGLDTARFQHLTGRAARQGAHLWVQLGHAGALADPKLGHPRGPSALAVSGLVCDELTEAEIDSIPKLFAGGARRAQELGFTGVQIHAAHGFLLSQFLSPLFNRRADDWGGPLGRRARLLIRVVMAVREAVGPLFPVAVKINSSDRLEGGFSERDAEALLELLDDLPIDLVEISAGTYFPGAASDSDSKSGEPRFVDFAHRATRRTSKPLMAAGGFKALKQALSARRQGALDVIGLGRALVLDPGLPRKWLQGGEDPVFPKFCPAPPPGGMTAWYTMRMTALALDREAQFTMDPNTALKLYDDRDDSRRARWSARFMRRHDHGAASGRRQNRCHHQQGRRVCQPK